MSRLGTTCVLVVLGIVGLAAAEQYGLPSKGVEAPPRVVKVPTPQTLFIPSDGEYILSVKVGDAPVANTRPTKLEAGEFEVSVVPVARSKPAPSSE